MRTLGLSALCLLVIACGSDEEADDPGPAGAYTVDHAAIIEEITRIAEEKLESTMDARREEGATPEERAARRKKAEEGMKAELDALRGQIEAVKIEITLETDGSFVASPGRAEPFRGTWKMDGSRVTLTPEGKSGAPQLTTASFANGTLRFPPEGSSEFLLLRRKQ